MRSVSICVDIVAPAETGVGDLAGVGASMTIEIRCHQRSNASI